jgi:PST family polysaccharide transporter
MTIVMTIFSMVYIPGLARHIHTNSVRLFLWGEIRRYVPLLAIGFLLYYLLLEYVLILVFSAEFAVAKEFGLWLVVGDFLRIWAMFYAFIVHVKGNSLVYSGMEILFYTLYIGIGLAVVREDGAEGLTVAYALAYAIYLGLYLTLYYGTNRIVKRVRT